MTRMIDSAIPNEYDDVLRAVYTLIKHFVERQAIVYQAMCDLAPHWIMTYDGRNAEMKPRAWKQFVAQCQQIPHTGFWGCDKEWLYLIRNNFCSLSHTTTEEILVWELGDLRQFDTESLMAHVQWLMSENNNPQIATLKPDLIGQVRSDNWCWKPFNGWQISAR